MSSQDVITQLTEPLRKLVLSASKGAGPSYFGLSEHDVTAVNTWIEKVAKENLSEDIHNKSLDSHLVTRTFLVNNYLTAADVAVFGALHPMISKQTPKEYYSYPSVTRYFNHIQTRPQIRSVADSATPPLPLVLFDIENAPKPARTVEPPKRKEKAPKVAAEAAATTPADLESGNNKAGKKERKEPKERKTEGVAAGVGDKKVNSKTGAAAANEPAVPVPSMIDLRVGQIIDVQRHPDADGLYVEQIDIGEETPRTVVSGLVNYIPIEQMRDRRLIAVCNLKPASMRGVKSYAMVLCATHKDGKEAGIEILDPPKHSKPGERVYFETFEDDKPLDQLNPKKKIFETIQPGFTTLETREAAWVNPVTGSVHRLRTHGGPDGVCLAPSFVGASLS